MAGRRCGAALIHKNERNDVFAPTGLASLRLPLLKLGQNGSFAPPCLGAVLRDLVAGLRRNKSLTLARMNSNFAVRNSKDLWPISIPFCLAARFLPSRVKLPKSSPRRKRCASICRPNLPPRRRSNCRLCLRAVLPPARPASSLRPLPALLPKPRPPVPLLQQLRWLALLLLLAPLPSALSRNVRLSLRPARP